MSKHRGPPKAGAAEPKLSDRFLFEFAAAVVQSLAAQGVIDPKGLTWPELFERSTPFVLRYLRSGSFGFSRDYTDSLQAEAKRLRRSYPELAVVLYATANEHRLNQFISALCVRSGLTEKEGSEVIRTLPLDAKMTWAPKLLKARSLGKKHIERVRRIAELRNRFVHYKWTPRSPEDEGFEQACRAALQIAPHVSAALERWFRNELLSGLELSPSALVAQAEAAGVLRTKRRSRRRTR